MPHGGVPNARSLTARDANRAIISRKGDAAFLAIPIRRKLLH
jgi:hypothetical protein